MWYPKHGGRSSATSSSRSRNRGFVFLAGLVALVVAFGIATATTAFATGGYSDVCSLSVSETQSRPMTSDELKACTTQPEPKVTYTEWTDGAKDCKTSTVTQTRTKTTTPYKWNGEAWVLDTANASSVSETQSRPMTSDELKACQPVLNRPRPTCEAATWQITNTGYIYDAGVTTKPADLPMSVTGPFEFSFDLSGLKPGTEVSFTFHYTLDGQTWQSLEETIKVPACTTQPEPKVTYTEWTDGAKDCKTSTVTQTRTKTTTPYKWNGEAWVLDTANASSVSETQSRPMTSDELKACKTSTGTPASRGGAGASPDLPDEVNVQSQQPGNGFAAWLAFMFVFGAGALVVKMRARERSI